MENNEELIKKILERKDKFLKEEYSDRHKYKHVVFDKDKDITSVVRISDNVLFELGDMVYSRKYTHEISSFSERMRQFSRSNDMLSGKLEIWVQYKNNEGGNGLCDLKQYNENIEINENNESFDVSLNS